MTDEAKSTATCSECTVECPRCKGVGMNYSPHYFDGYARCMLCGGHGRVIEKPQAGGSMHYERVA